MKKTLLLFASFLLVVPFAGAAEGQPTTDRPAGRFAGTVEVTEVLLDVLALRDGEVVTGLDADDFLVEENGEPVEVTGVTFYSTRYTPEGEPLVAGEVPSSRYFIFFFHDLQATESVLVRKQLEAARESRRWVEDEMLPSDWVAVASYDFKLKLHQDFTQDRQALIDAIDDAQRRRDPERNVGRHGRELPPAAAPSLLRHLPQGKQLRKETRRVYDGIRLLAEAAGHVVGRKNLMLFSIGFGDFQPGNPIPLPDQRYYPQMLHALNDHNVAVYPIDLAPPEVEHQQSHFLTNLAVETGGRYYRNFVSFITPLREISEEANGYYLLSYQSEHPADESGYQRVKVKVKDDSIKVRARQGYRYGEVES